MWKLTDDQALNTTPPKLEKVYPIGKSSTSTVGTIKFMQPMVGNKWMFTGSYEGIIGLMNTQV